MTADSSAGCYQMMDGDVDNFCCVGLYLASGGQDKKLVVWDVEKKEVLAQKDMESMPGALAWHTGDKGNTLASIGEDGVIHLWQSAIPSHMLGPSAPLDDALPKLAHSKEMSEGAAPPSYLLERWAVASMTLSKCQLYSSTSRCAALPKPTYSKEIDWRYSPAFMPSC